MLPTQLDHIFPFLCLGYGAIMTFTLNSPKLVKLSDRLPADLANQWKNHRGLAMICLVVGAIWSLQNIWFSLG